MGSRLEATALSEPRSLIGTWRRFGATGPLYEIVGTGDLSRDAADRTMRIRLVETGEELNYCVLAILDDPEAR